MASGSDVAYGDVVKFVYDTTMDGDKSLFGRVYAKLDTSRTRAYYHSNSPHYVVKPDEGSIKNVDLDDIMVDAFTFVHPNEIEWGVVPAEPYLVVPEYMLSQVYSGQMMAHFKKNGLCPRCGDTGYWQALALYCKWHGMFG